MDAYAECSLPITAAPVEEFDDLYGLSLDMIDYPVLPQTETMLWGGCVIERFDVHSRSWFERVVSEFGKGDPDSLLEIGRKPIELFLKGL